MKHLCYSHLVVRMKIYIENSTVSTQQMSSYQDDRFQKTEESPVQQLHGQMLTSQDPGSYIGTMFMS